MVKVLMIIIIRMEKNKNLEIDGNLDSTPLQRKKDIWNKNEKEVYV